MSHEGVHRQRIWNEYRSFLRGKKLTAVPSSRIDSMEISGSADGRDSSSLVRRNRLAGHLCLSVQVIAGVPEDRSGKNV